MAPVDDAGALPEFSTRPPRAGEPADHRGRPYAELIEEASAADVSGWDWAWLTGRATEERPPWGYARLLGQRLAAVESALDLETGGGEVLAGLDAFPARMCATEAWTPNVERARAQLGARGVEVLAVRPGERLPFPDASFALVSSRHPVRPDWAEIARVLADDGTYFAQHVGPGSAFELIEFFLGELPDEAWAAREADHEIADAAAHGLEAVDLHTARLKMEFFDIGAVVWLLRRCSWWVPDFSVERYAGTLARLDEQLRAEGPFVAHSTRHLLELRRAPRG